jgi:hypothetical protein
VQSKKIKSRRESAFLLRRIAQKFSLRQIFAGTTSNSIFAKAKINAKNTIKLRKIPLDFPYWISKFEKTAMIYYCYRKSTASQRILDRAARDATHYRKITVPFEKIVQNIAKLNAIFNFNLTPMQRFKRKDKQMPVADLIVFWNRAKPDAADLFLMIYEDATRFSDSEQFLRWDAKEPLTALVGADKLVLTNQYELVQLPRKKSTIKYAPNHAPSSWTWRMTDAYYAHFQKQIKKGIDCWTANPVPLKQVVHSLYGTLGYRGARMQVGYLMTELRTNWKQRFNTPFSAEVSLNLSYLGRLKDDCKSLEELFTAREVILKELATGT